jgi:ParB family chromosome partitioning protein
VSYNSTEGMKRLYRVAGELNEGQSARYDELAEIAEQDDLTDEQRDEWDALHSILEGDYMDTQRQHSGLYVYIAYDGELRADAAYVRPEDFADAIAAGVLTGHAASSAAATAEQHAAPKSPYSAALVGDMQTARLHALQSALLDKPELLLDLLAFMFSGKGGAYETLFDLLPREANIMPSKPEGLDADTRLATGADRPSWMKASERIDAFSAFQAEGKKARNAALSLGLTGLGVYGLSHVTRNFAQLTPEVWTIVAVATLSAFLGAFVGSRVLKKITLRAVQIVVAVTMIALGSGLASGLI